MTVEPIKVSVGGNERTLPRFRSFKVTLALDILSGVTGEVRELLETLAAERKRWAAENPVTITRTMCMDQASSLARLADDERKLATTETDPEQLAAHERVADDLAARAANWERQLEDMGDKDKIELPGTMPQEEEILVAMPKALEMRTQLTQLIGLALVPDDELKQWWTDDEVLDKLHVYGNDLLTQLELGEEVELAAAVKQMVQAQLRPRQAALQVLRELRGWWTGTEGQETSTNGSTHEQTSSISSPAPTDGDPSASSSDSPTTTTSPSPSA